jgi:hypothetical protein
MARMPSAATRVKFRADAAFPQPNYPEDGGFHAQGCPEKDGGTLETTKTRQHLRKYLNFSKLPEPPAAFAVFETVIWAIGVAVLASKGSAGSTEDHVQHRS